MDGTNYGERIARVEENQKATNATLGEVKKDVKAVLSRLDNLENVFVTRREIALVKAVIGVGFSLVGLYLAYGRK